MNGFVLKMVALITMLIDHVGVVLIKDPLTYIIARCIGRLAFPIYCFLIVEGFIHTKNVRKYLIRLGIFALISELPFDLAFADRGIKYGYLMHQNVFFTLFIGLTVIYLMSIIDKRYNKKTFVGNLLSVLVIIGGSIIAILLQTDYHAFGVLMIVVFYIFRKSNMIITVAVYLLNSLLLGGLQQYATLAMALIYFYNGKRGPQVNKYVFYAFYPVHILVIYLISLLPYFK